MKPIQGFDKVQPLDGSGFPALPPGGYICEIKTARENQTRNGAAMIEVLFDIAEGEYKGFYNNRYQAERLRANDAKWRGIFYQPVYDRTGEPSGFFKGLITAIERSNPGYKWDWDETKLKGKRIGFVYGDEEYLNQSNEVRVSCKPKFPRTVDEIRAGVKPPEIKRLQQAAQQAPLSAPGGYSNGFAPVPPDDDSPF